MPSRVTPKHTKREKKMSYKRFLKGMSRHRFIRIPVVGLIFTPRIYHRYTEEFGNIGYTRPHAAIWGKFHFCRRPFVEELAPAAFSLEGIAAAPTRLIASSRPCVHIFPEPIKTLRFPDFFPTHFQTWNILLRTHAYIHIYIHAALTTRPQVKTTPG